VTDQILTKDSVPIGEKVIDLICLAWASRRPIILRGPHGLGKSEIVEQAAKSMEINYRCMDLSIMEPPDLLGMPKIVGESLKYYPPATLPVGETIEVQIKSKGKKAKIKKIDHEGVLCFEELNRCDDAMQAPCLQLLTARKLNEYELPSGWSIIACINPSGDEYNVNDIDPALLSRFMVIDICAGKKEWLKWANKNKVHEAVVNVVSEHPDPFDVKTGVPPRTWHYVSQILSAFNKYEGLNEDIRRDSLYGYLNTEWTQAVIEALVDMGEMEKEVLRDDDDDEMIDPQSLKKADKLPPVVELVSKYTATYRKQVLKMSRAKISANMELMANTFNNMQHTKDAEAFCDHIFKPRHLNNLNKLFNDIPNDAKKNFRDNLNADISDEFLIEDADDKEGTNAKSIKIDNPQRIRDVMYYKALRKAPKRLRRSKKKSWSI